MIEVYIGTDKERLLLPVTPSLLEVNRGANYSTINVLKVGEIPIFNGITLKTIDISSFFPNQVYPFCTSKNFMKPYEFSEKFQIWLKEATPLRIIITQTPINMPCIITDFNTREKDGTRDLYFDLKLKEYKSPNVTIYNKDNNNSSNNKREAPTEQNKQRQHKVVKGDSLWSISKKYYGDGSKYKKIKEANKDKYPELKTSNVIYTRMTLTIP